MNANVKITVLRRTLNEDFLQEYAESMWVPCQLFEEGQEFLCDGIKMPAGFCSWAWADLHQFVLTLARGGNFVGVQPGVFISNCTDGFRPVSFKLERVDPT